MREATSNVKHHHRVALIDRYEMRDCEIINNSARIKLIILEL